jgi:hypothetical protein
MATAQPTERHEEIQFRQLLEEAVTKHGSMMQAYSLFWNEEECPCGAESLPNAKRGPYKMKSA